MVKALIDKAFATAPKPKRAGSREKTRKAMEGYRNCMDNFAKTARELSESLDSFNDAMNAAPPEKN